MTTCLRGGRLVLPSGVLDDHDVLVVAGRVATLAPTGTVDLPAGTELVDLDGAHLGPGFVDLHCHAGGDAWFHDDPAAAAAYHLRHGTTTMLATTVLMPTHDENVDAVRTIADAVVAGRARTVAGIHMEGPYLNPEFGAFKERSRRPVASEYLAFAEAGRGLLRWMTIAPELEGTARMVHDLQQATGGAMTFSVGHSRASSDQIRALVPAGLRMATHLFNASGCSIEPARHAGTREVGVDEAVLACPDIVAEVIADRGGRHVRPELLDLAVRAKGLDGVVLVTDATAADGEAPASDAQPSDVRWNATGGLAGSALTMDAAVGNMVRHTGLSLPDAWRLASRTPASALGLLGSVGELLPGRRAHLVACRHDPDSGLTIERVWFNGQVIEEVAS